MRDPALRPLIVEGYRRALFIGAYLCLVIALVVVYGVPAGRLLLFANGAGLIVGAIICAVRKTWSVRLSGAVIALGVLGGAIGWSLGNRGPHAQFVKDLISVTAVAYLFFGLPRVLEKEHGFGDRVRSKMAEARYRATQAEYSEE
ncbi:MAG TPA: hypothetical protein VK669_08795 [Candidatus Limnocylindrales bacterium]|nr:hypothetical protein [Candidatus Limnocylindrales bacterium]